MIIIDDFNKNNLIGLTNYTAGHEFVRNFIVLEKSETEAASMAFAYIRGNPAENMFIYIYVNDTIITPPALTTSAQIVNYYNENSTFIDAGLRLELYNPYDADKLASNPFYGETEAFRIVSSGLVEANTISLECYFWVSGGTVYYEDNVYNQKMTIQNPVGAYGEIWLSVMNRENNSTLYVKDTTSVLQYGLKIYTLENADTIIQPLEIQDALSAKLAQLKDPKARCFVTVPFDYEQPNELDLVEVRLSYQNVGRFKDFKEGGHFKSWTDKGTYRYKQFYIVGINHNKEGDKTSLRLIEKV